ncbi:MAG: Hint domain-containing protein [Proteobacteria bacterium]|nr:Hint domain-containing protein [Pseudomonadota bacterium]
MPTFTPYAGSDSAALVSALLAPGSGINVLAGSIALTASALDAVNFYDGSLAPLGIGAGLLLTSGTTPGTTNTIGWFGQDNSGTSSFLNGDPNIDAVVNTVFQTQSYDATTLSFDFTVADPAATSVSFDIVFGSDEYPEWVDLFVDSAIVMVNGVNYALFNHDPMHPLSVISSNLAAGYFQDNAGNVLPIEYDGVSHVLKIVAPIIPGATNHITIGIADTGDHILDSGIFIANLAAGNIPGSGVVVPPSSGSDSPDNIIGTAQAEYFDLKGGDDTCYAGAGDDIVVAGSGNDSVFGGSGADELMGGTGNDQLDGGADADTAVFSGPSAQYTIAVIAGGFTVTDNNAGPGSEGTDTLTGVEFLKFSDGLFAIGPGGVLTPVANPGAPPANTPGSVVISGIAADGKTLTATVSDPDGIAGAISYQWQVSGDNGLTWSDVGIDANTFTVTAADVGKDIHVIAQYIDNLSQSEAPVSAIKAIQAIGEGDLLVTLMHLDAPPGASTINPLTTLAKAAISLGLSPNVAVTIIKDVLGLPASISLQAYDPYAILLNAPSDPVALAVEKVAVQAAILTSLSDDDSGTNLMLKIIEAAGANKTLDLANADDLATILGIDLTGITDKNNYPQPLKEIFDRNDNIAQAATVGDIEIEWQDFLTIQANVASTSIADLSIHVNQAPEGQPTAVLADGTENTAYPVAANLLLQGFTDPENDPLSVSGLTVDHGSVVDNGNGTFTITPSASYVGPVELTYDVIDGQGGSIAANQLFVIAASEAAPCFVAGTRIQTIDGPVAVEDLQIGQYVVTRDGRRSPVTWIGRRRVDLMRHTDPGLVRPIRIRRGAVADGQPRRDLLVSPDHALFIDGALIPARLLVNGASIRIDTGRQSVEYFHIQLDRHDILLAEGLPAESYLDTGNRAMFDNGGDAVCLHPDFGTGQQAREALSCVPLVTDPVLVEPAWRALASRASALGLVVLEPMLTDEPDLRVVAGDACLTPISVRDGQYLFLLPSGAGPVRLLSRAARPCDDRPWIEDRRRLGVMVRRLALRNDRGVRDIPLDDPSLDRGWWAVEVDDHWPCRWTDGEAVLPATGPGLLEVDLAASMRYPLAPSVRRRAAA